MRLGAYPAVLEADSIVAEAYGATEVSERHRHRYEVNNDYRDRIAESGLRFSGTSPDGHLVEFVEYPRDVHPVPRRHPGASRAEEPADAAAPAVRGVHRRGARIQGRRTASRWRYLQRSNGAEHSDAEAAGPRARRPWLTTTSTPSPAKRSTSGRFSRCASTRCAMPGGGTARREVVEHYGAVAVVAIDDDDQCRAGLPVPAPARPAAVGTARRTARRRRRGSATLTAARELEEEAGLARRRVARARRRRLRAGFQRRGGAHLSRHRAQPTSIGRSRTTRKPT